MRKVILRQGVSRVNRVSERSLYAPKTAVVCAGFAVRSDSSLAGEHSEEVLLKPAGGAIPGDILAVRIRPLATLPGVNAG